MGVGAGSGGVKERVSPELHGSTITLKVVLFLFQDLVGKLKDACKSIEKAASN